MPSAHPNFSPLALPFVSRLSRDAASIESWAARWLAGRSLGVKTSSLLGARGHVVDARILGTRVVGERLMGESAVRGQVVGERLVDERDPHAACAEVRIASESLEVWGPSALVRRLAQRLLSGPDELDAPRPLGVAEQALWSLLVAAMLVDLDAPGEVWPLERPISGNVRVSGASGVRVSGDVRSGTSDVRASGASGVRVFGASGASDVPVSGVSGVRVSGASDVRVSGASDVRASGVSGVRVSGVFVLDVVLDIDGAPFTVGVVGPRTLLARVAPPRRLPAWELELPIVVARCVLPRAAVRALTPRDVVIVERGLALVVGEGEVGLAAAPRAVEARVATGYVRRPMALVDDAEVELTVQLGAARVSLREAATLAVGQVISLGRPLIGPFEVRAAGRLVGQGELVDVDGEVGVRMVSVAEER